MKDIKELYDVVVIGGGPAGLTAALYLARARYRVVVVEKEHFGGQITITDEVVNFPGVERTSGKALTETMRRQAQSFGAEFLLAEVTGLIMDGDVKTVQTSRGELHCFGVLLATGAHPRSVDLPERQSSRGGASLTVPPVTESFLQEKKSLWWAAVLQPQKKACF